jgi:RNA polymerase sigma-70 factor, ECF subfamily
MTPSDHDLIGRTAARDRAAFAALYDRYAPRAFGLILRIMRNRTDAEDVLQETFLQVWNQAARFDPNRSAPDVWLLLIARSRAVDRLRKRRVATKEELPDPATRDEPDDGLIRREDAEQLRSALEQLPPEQRDLIRRAFFGGLTHEQIATELNIPLGTVKTRIRLGMTRLRDRLAALSPAEGHAR